MALLNGGVAIVTGGSSGIGRASALAFAREGARVVVVADVDREGGEATAASIRADGVEAAFVMCDVSNEGSVRSLLGETLERYGSVDYAHNNAGVAPRPSPVAEVEEADWDRLMSVHLKGIWLCLKHELQAMLPRSKGAIVNTASTAGLGGAPLMSVYSAAKHGVIGLTKTTALECSNSGIRVNCICPGHTDTPMHKETREAAAKRIESRGGVNMAPSPPAFGRIQRLADPREQGEVAVWLCSERASYVTGAVIVVDGGQTAQLSP